MAPKQEVRSSPALAALWGAPIGLLGGLIGLGGAEFRLHVLAGVFGYCARRGVALNLAISLVTVVSALIIRGGTLSLAPLPVLLPVVVAMILGAVSAAYCMIRGPAGERRDAHNADNQTPGKPYPQARMLPTDLGLYNLALAVYPFGLDGVEPRALLWQRQLTILTPSPLLLDLAVV